MGSLQDELKKVASVDLAENKPDVQLSARPTTSIAEQQKLAGIVSPNPVPHPENLAGYAKVVESLSGDLLDHFQQVSASLDRYQPSVSEAKLGPGRSYRDLKIAVKGLHERLLQARRVAAEISK